MPCLSQHRLYQITYIYLALPLLIFMLSWLNYPSAAVLTVLFAIGLYKICSTNQLGDDISWNLAPRLYLTILIFAAIWCFFAGIGYFYYQSWDYHFRNAIFHDLIDYPWPVWYDKADTPLVYYIGFWLFPALFAKFSSFFISDVETVFLIGNVCLYFYATFGVALIFMHLAALFRLTSGKKICAIILIFIFFSGLDIIGYLFFQRTGQPFAYHLEWWSTYIQYSSFSTCLFWVFNQFIPAALGTLLMYSERSIKNFGFILPLVFFLAPYPGVGIACFMIIYGIYQFWLTTDKSRFITQDIFSLSNLIGILALLPLVALYFITNSNGIDRIWFFSDFISFPQLVLFWVLEFLLYSLILIKFYHKDVFFIGTIVFLVLISLFRFDQQNNFCTRASIPAIIILAIFILDFLLNHLRENKFLVCFLCLFLFLGAFTPAMEFYRGIHYTLEAKHLNLVKDDLKTLNKAIVVMPDFGWRANHQFTAQHYDTDFFWRYFAKRSHYLQNGSR